MEGDGGVTVVKIEKKVKVEAAKAEIEQFRHRLGYLRTWIQGFEAAGGKGPHDADVLRQIQVWMGSAK